MVAPEGWWHRWHSGTQGTAVPGDGVPLAQPQIDPPISTPALFPVVLPTAPRPSDPHGPQHPISSLPTATLVPIALCPHSIPMVPVSPLVHAVPMTPRPLLVPTALRAPRSLPFPPAPSLPAAGPPAWQGGVLVPPAPPCRAVHFILGKHSAPTAPPPPPSVCDKAGAGLSHCPPPWGSGGETEAGLGATCVPPVGCARLCPSSSLIPASSPMWDRDPAGCGGGTSSSTPQPLAAPMWG